MAICMIFDMPGVTQQQYDAILDALGARLGASPPPEAGHLMHIAGPADGGWRVIEVWDSHDDASRFWQEKFGCGARASRRRRTGDRRKSSRSTTSTCTGKSNRLHR